ncbi:21 kDa protein-like [Malania oleifera]|uniref:21 kDa protein-like n=1 Tax=Malania oleifera TaxID=397392 RepID=UPI0025AE1D3F|nr:21 kDa protein-like [Malania oleifera]
METRRSALIFSVAVLSSALIFFIQPIPAIGYAAEGTGDLNFISRSCRATRYPVVCYASLSRYARTIQGSPFQLARAAMAVSLSKVSKFKSRISGCLGQAEYGGDKLAASALHDCFTNLDMAVDQIHDSIRQMRTAANNTGSVPAGGGSRESFKFQMSNVQTWMSAALTCEDTCTDGFEGVAKGPLKTEVSEGVEKVSQYTSNALALVNSYVDQVVGNEY